MTKENRTPGKYVVNQQGEVCNTRTANFIILKRPSEEGSGSN